jgi:S1-C subfamily serine protease
MLSVTSKRLGVGVLTFVLSIAAPAGAKANEEVYRKVAPSTALIMKGGGLGTGWVIDVENRLLVTARHVVADGRGGVVNEVDVTLAQLDKNGNVITDLRHYLTNKATLTVKGKVVYDSARRDMALIQLPQLPAGIQALKLATESARPGQNVHVIGNSSFREGGLFAYSYGKVRTTFLFDPPGDAIQAKVVSHQTPTNKGDSGGPVVNDKGEVIGCISQGTTGVTPAKDDPFYAVQVTDYSIDAFEIAEGLRQWQAQRLAAQHR